MELESVREICGEPSNATRQYQAHGAARLLGWFEKLPGKS
jgi:hypothetical protein